MIYHILLSFLSYLLGCQIYLRDFHLLKGTVNYQIGKAQYITYLSTVIFAAIVIIYIADSSLWQFLEIIPAYIVIIFFEYLWAKVNSRYLFWSYVARMGIVVFTCYCLYDILVWNALPFVVMGYYTRNCKYSVVHGNDFFIAPHMTRKVFSQQNLNAESLQVVDDSMIPDFSYAGKKNLIKSISKKYNVLDYGIIPNNTKEQSNLLNDLIDMVGKSGGGTIFFPKGKYYFNTESEHMSFIQINHSDVTLEGEVDEHGKPVSVLVNCNNTLSVESNPWLSPFFITTGEKIQASNIFWGLQFKKKKNIVTRSNSMSDPGSDGTILTPEYACKVVKDSFKDDFILYVENAFVLNKYILVGMYNTSPDGNLIKDILGQELLEGWKTAKRAGEEEAPSFQWLVEIDSIIDEHTIRLTRPLLCDISMKYVPEIFNVSMLENITIKNLYFTSLWNGLFLHHGSHRYYSVKQTQEMDYGWNGINMKRVAHGLIENVIIKNFTNPLYIMDSRNITVDNLEIKGYDGHQGIKLYEHACDNLIKNIRFRNHFADMMGGEGNAYGNVFSEIDYLNPIFKPCEYDFHGFSEGPMSPPAFNLFELIRGFRHIKMAGADYNQPGCAQWNFWWNCISEGEEKGDYIFDSVTYNYEIGLRRKIQITIKSLLKIIPSRVKKDFNQRMLYETRRLRKRSDLYKLFQNIWIFGMISQFQIPDNHKVKNVSPNNFCSPISRLCKNRSGAF